MFQTKLKYLPTASSQSKVEKEPCVRMTAVKCIVNLLDIVVRPKLVQFFPVSFKVSNLCFELLFYCIFANLKIVSICKLSCYRFCFSQLTCMTSYKIIQWFYNTFIPICIQEYRELTHKWFVIFKPGVFLMLK